MVLFTIKANTVEEMTALRDRICEALVGSPAFINNEIAVCDSPCSPDMFEFFIGESNNADVSFEFSANDFPVRERED